MSSQAHTLARTSLGIYLTMLENISVVTRNCLSCGDILICVNRKREIAKNFILIKSTQARYTLVRRKLPS